MSDDPMTAPVGPARETSTTPQKAGQRTCYDFVAFLVVVFAFVSPLVSCSLVDVELSRLVNSLLVFTS